jgi:hypothetical protein
MPLINALYWNIQNFSALPTYEPADQSPAGFIAVAPQLVQADRRPADVS